MSSSFGRLFQISTWGESHGKAIGVVVDGCPSMIEISEADIQTELDRRRPGQSRITTQRREGDRIEILSGTFDGKTTGTPISMLVMNEDARSKDYSEISEAYRPSHADYTYDAKYGFRDFRGGGRSSARETIGRVASGAIAQKILKQNLNTEIVAYVKQVHELVGEIDPQKVKRTHVEKNAVRCPDQTMAEQMFNFIDKTRKNGDSVGGIIECVIRNVPPGLGEPIFDRFEADLAKAMLSLPATKGFEIGSGFGGIYMTGLQHNDPFYSSKGKIRTKTNKSGGVQGGITNGEDVIFRVAFKPTATILQPQKTVTPDGKSTTLKPRGRHDPCVLPRAVPIVEAMAALVMVDHYLISKAYK
jgi:chorismate synthase